VDSEELAGRLEAAGWDVVEDPAEASVAVVNTCGFVEQAKKDSVDVLLDAAQLRDAAGSATTKVVAVGCLAERYGSELAESLPEADAVLGFDAYPDLAAQLQAVLQGNAPAPHVPRDRRALLPISPVARRGSGLAVPGHGDSHLAGTGSAAELPAGVAPASGPRVVRRRLDGRPWAPLKLASGCDRRCTFCAIPAFRGAYVSRHPDEVVVEAQWLAGQGVREIFLVSENTSSYGKDLGDLRLLEALLPRLAAIDGLDRIRVSYLQPAEVRPGLIDALTATPGVVPYFDLSFQHASPSVLRRMRRFGSGEDFLKLIGTIRERVPAAGIRSNVIVGFPGETEDDLAELTDFLSEARLDVVGVFGYSDEDGTEAARLAGKLDPDEVAERVSSVSALVEELICQRAEDRIGEVVDVLVEELDADGEVDLPVPVGRAAHQGPEVDGVTRLERSPAHPAAERVGALVRARVVATDGPDLIAVPED
jgi:ribosomal protein S12 methylthiotransferase RimO